eukprot:gene20153-7661_t
MHVGPRRRLVHAMVHCDGEGGVRVRQYADDQCAGEVAYDSGTVAQGLCLSTPTGAHVIYDCPLAPPLRRPARPNLAATHRPALEHGAGAGASAKGACFDLMGDGKGPWGQIECKGSEVGVYEYSGAGCGGRHTSHHMYLEGACIRHPRGYGGVLPAGAGRDGVTGIDCRKARLSGDHCAVSAATGWDCVLLTVPPTTHTVRGI